MTIIETDAWFEIQGSPQPIWKIDYLDQDNQLQTFTLARYEALDAVEAFVNSEKNPKIVNIYQEGYFTPSLVVPRTHLA